LTRKERQRRTRSRLLRSAARVFARRGLAQASIDEVAAAAGFTKGAFYANFSSKEDLFLAMLDERFDERLAEIERLTSTDEGLESQARAAGDEFVRYLAADPDWQRLFFEFAAHAARNEPFRAALVKRYRGLREGLARVFERRARALGLPSPVPVEQLALMTLAMANGFALERLLEPEAASDELYGMMLLTFFAGLRALAQERGEAPAAAASSASASAEAPGADWS
jgi:AcrR family transcriptional regulator